jgi:hypothetical protein
MLGCWYVIGLFISLPTEVIPCHSAHLPPQLCVYVWSGGCDKIRPLWRHYYQNTTGVIFVVDSNDRERIGEAREELYRMMAEPELNDCIRTLGGLF